MQKYIFNRKILNDRLQQFKIQEEILYQKFKLINNWQTAFETRNIMNTKEETIKGYFLQQIFSEILGYATQIEYENDFWNLEIENKTDIDGTKADAAIGYYKIDSKNTYAVIEIKDANTPLDKKQSRINNQTPVEQAFSYQLKTKECKWVIVSNLKEIRLYHNSTSTEYEEFKIEKLSNNINEFKKFYYLMRRDFFLSDLENTLIDKLYNENEKEEKKITDEFYQLFSNLRKDLFEHLKVNNNMDELLLFEKTQKILDRFIFIAFCEDSGLLPEKIFNKIIDNSKNDLRLSETKAWDQLVGLFESIDQGHAAANINKYNGGLFKHDRVLNSLIIKDSFIKKFTSISAYDFQSEIGVSILGHIFEQSITDIEEIELQIKGIETKALKRKKTGVFYTPDYITQLMVEDTIGRWLLDQQKKLGEDNLPKLTEKDFEEYKKKKTSKRITKVEKHIEYYRKLLARLANIKILDPACGSGAFLNAAYDYLVLKGKEINEQLNNIEDEQLSIYNLDKEILKNNLYGVDINKQSIEITKLSLWLKTANKYEPLDSLNHSIKNGDSLISDKDFSEFAFQWEDEFSEIIERGGFDIIIGNPPYVRVQHISDLDSKYYFENYSFTYGKIDISLLFFEKSMSLLSKDGYLSFISSSQWLNTDYGSNIREKLSEGYLEKIIDFGSLRVFKDVETYPAIFSVRKSQHEFLKYVLIKGLEPEYLINMKYDFVSYENLDRDSWNFSKSDLNKHLIDNNIKFKKLACYADVLSGTLTGMDKVFIVTKNIIESENLEEGILYPYLYQNKDVKPFEEIPENTFVIYPYYQDQDGKTKLMAEETLRMNYPNVYQYLLRYKESLTQRKDSRKLYALEDWYRFLRSGNLDMVASDKVIFKGIDTVTKCGYHNNGSLFNGANCPGIIIYNPEVSQNYILGILNSELMTSYLNTICPKKLDGYFRYNITNLKKIPIVIGSDEIIKEVEDLVEKIKEKSSRRSALVQTFNNRIKYNLVIEKIPNKIKDFYQLNFNEFLDELKKKSKVLTLVEQDEWEIYFDEYKMKISSLINETELLVLQLNTKVKEIYSMN